MSKHPKGIFLLIFVEMWESFSFFGMRTLLVLFMIQKLGFGNDDAIGVYSLFTSMIYLGGLLGGYCADRILGIRASIFFGGGLIGIGHLCLTMEAFPSMVFVALGFIVVGTSLFYPNLTALVGQLYNPSDSMKERSGYTLFYAGMNLGGFLAAISCGYFAQAYGWNFGFGLAALGMMIGLGSLAKYKYLLKGKGDAPEGISIRTKGICVAICLVMIGSCTIFLHAHQYFLRILPAMGLVIAFGVLYNIRNQELFKKILPLCGFILLYVGFFMIEDLMGSLLMIFCEDKVNRVFGGFEVPSSALVAVNPFGIVLFGMLLSGILRKFASVQETLSAIKMNSIAFLLLGLSFGILFIGTEVLDSSGLVSMIYVVISFGMIALAELFIVPTLYSYCSWASPVTLRGQMMSLVVFGRSLASFFSGELGKAVITSNSYTELDLFAVTAIVSLSLSAILVFAYFRKETQFRSYNV